MKKIDLAERLADETGLPVSTSNRVLTAFTDAIQKGVAQDGQVTIQKFGTFRRRPKAVTHDLDGPCPPRVVNTVRWRASKLLTRRINNGGEQ